MRLSMVALLSTVAGFAQSQEPVSPTVFAETMGAPFGQVEITTQMVAPGLYVLFGAGGNIVASTGSQGVLLVDDQYPQMVPKIRAAIEDLGGGAVNFVVNTHWHFDHAGGNPLFAESGSVIVAQNNSREMMLDRRLVNFVTMVIEQHAFSPEVLPMISYEDRMQLHFNGQRIDLMHFSEAHTAGDTAVFFRDVNAVHTGDVFLTWGYPFIDADNGGGLDGLILFCESILAEINEDTIVIPGHGSVSTYADLESYIGMLRTIRERIAVLIANGATLEEVVAAKPTEEWDGDDPTRTIRFLDRAYASMTR